MPHVTLNPNPPTLTPLAAGSSRQAAARPVATAVVAAGPWAPKRAVDAAGGEGPRQRGTSRPNGGTREARRWRRRLLGGRSVTGRWEPHFGSFAGPCARSYLDWWQLGCSNSLAAVRICVFVLSFATCPSKFGRLLRLINPSVCFQLVIQLSRVFLGKKPWIIQSDPRYHLIKPFWCIQFLCF